jgi:hypothetical protein
MAQFVGRSGADAIGKAITKICSVDAKYHAKFVTAVGLARSADLLTDAQVTIAINFLNDLSQICAIIQIVAGNSGFTSG